MLLRGAAISYFRAGAFQPDSISGQALLAHELAQRR